MASFSGSWMILSAADGFSGLDPGESLNAVFTIGCGFKSFIAPGEEAPNGEDYLQQMSAGLVSSTNWARIAWDGEDKNRNGVLDADEDQDGDGVLDRYLLPDAASQSHTAR